MPKKEIEKAKTVYWLVNLDDKEIIEFSSEKELGEWLSGEYAKDMILEEAISLGLFLFTSPPTVPYLEKVSIICRERYIAEKENA